MTLGGNIQKIRKGAQLSQEEFAEMFGVPNQSMPGLLDFSLDFHVKVIYCNINLEDREVEITWDDYNTFYASSVSKEDNKIIGSTSKLEENEITNMKMLADELGIPEKEMSEVMEKGNELYHAFYIK